MSEELERPIDRRTLLVRAESAVQGQRSVDRLQRRVAGLHELAEPSVRDHVVDDHVGRLESEPGTRRC